MDAPLISVIVPVYKVEAYLYRCVQSIVDQTYQNLEIILVDDGSPDNCGAMCDAWAEKDSRIKVIHKANGGGAQARNVGLDHATGKFIGFVDSDDFIHPEMYRYLYQILLETGSNIAECGYYLTSKDVFPQEEITEELWIFNTEEALRENINGQICRQLLWNKLYTYETIGDVRMVEGKIIDDEFFTYRVLARAHKIVVSNQKLYAYRQQENSIMHQSYSVKWLDAIEAKTQRLNFVERHYPRLTECARKDLLFSCMYHGQLAMKDLDANDKGFVLSRLSAIIENTKGSVGSLSFTHKCWLWLARRNLKLCCRTRNMLGIGL